jgi:hypothetical protein
MVRIELSGSFDCVVLRYAQGNFAQDDRRMKEHEYLPLFSVVYLRFMDSTLSLTSRPNRVKIRLSGCFPTTGGRQEQE